MTQPPSNRPGDGHGIAAIPSTDPSEPMTPMPMVPGLPSATMAAIPLGFGTASPTAVSGIITNSISDQSTELSKAASYSSQIAASLKEALAAAQAITKEFQSQRDTARQTSQHARAATKGRPGKVTTLTIQPDGTPSLHELPSSGTEGHADATAPTPPSVSTGPPVPPASLQALPTSAGDDFEATSLNSMSFSSNLQQFTTRPGAVSQYVASKLHSALGASRMGVPNISQTDDGSYYDHDAGRFLDPENDTNDAARVGTYTSRMASRTRILGGLESAATGQGSLTSTLLGGVTKDAGEIGAVVGIADVAQSKVGNFLVSQRAADQPYQQAMGVGTSGALKQRVEGDMFKWSQWGVMSGGQAQQLFQGVTSIMPNQAGRQDALDFAVGQLKSYGMSISDSLGVINTAVKSGMDNFSALTTSLNSVADAAKAAGNNVGLAQQAFAANYQQAASNIGGAGALGAATSVSVAQAQLIPALNGVSFGGLNDESSLYQVAAQAGVSYTQVLGLSQQPGGADWLANQQQDLLNQTINNSVSPNALNAIQSQIKAAARGGQITQAQIQTIAANAEASGAISGPQIQAFAQSIGVTIQPGQEGAYLVQMLAKRNNISGPADAVLKRQQALIKESASNTVNGQKIQTGMQAAVGTTNVGRGASAALKARGALADSQEAAIAKQIGVNTGGNAGTAGHDMENYYNDYVQKTGKRDPVIEQLLANYDPSRRYTVQTASGARVVDLKQGIQNYADQFQNGSAIIAQGAQAGDTVGQIAPGSATDTVAASATKKATSGSKPSTKNSGAAGKVEISLAPGLANLFQFSTSGGAYLSPAQQDGVPAEMFPPTYDLPTGGP